MRLLSSGVILQIPGDQIRYDGCLQDKQPLPIQTTQQLHRHSGSEIPFALLITQRKSFRDGYCWVYISSTTKIYLFANNAQGFIKNSALAREYLWQNSPPSTLYPQADGSV
jgi:hypothetical protein